MSDIKTKRINFTPSKIKAYVRQLSASEIVNAKAMQDDSTLEIVINKRRISQDMYIDFKGGSYQVGAIDNFDFIQPEIKFRAKPVIPVTWDLEETRHFNG
jgi:SPP1 family predicted phage head-tail adaptor